MRPIPPLTRAPEKPWIPEQPPVPASRKDIKMRPRTDFFSDIMGMDEREFQSPETGKIPNFLKRKANGDYLLTTPKGEFSAGKFQIFTLQQLRNEAEEKLAHSGPLNSGRLHVIQAAFDENMGQWARIALDVTCQQADPRNKNALFLLASNFNTLETTSYTDPIEKSGALTSYPTDHTQGPAAAISAAPGLIFRQYFMFAEKYPEEPSKWRQTAREHINLLDDLKIREQNGYIIDTPENIIKEIVEQNSGKFKIAFQRNIQVTGGCMANSWHDHQTFYDPEQIIHQAFAAALALDYPGVFRYSAAMPAMQNVAKLILNWTYEAVLKLAYIQGINKVFLTIVGGGVFNNDPLWVVNALASQADFIKKSGLEVILNNFQFDRKRKDVEDAERNILRTIGGTFTTYRYTKAPVVEDFSPAPIIQGK